MEANGIEYGGKGKLQVWCYCYGDTIRVGLGSECARGVLARNVARFTPGDGDPCAYGMPDAAMSAEPVLWQGLAEQCKEGEATLPTVV